MEQRDGKSPKPERDTAVKSDSCTTSMLVLAGVVDLSEAGGGKWCWRGLREKMTTFVSD